MGRKRKLMERYLELFPPSGMKEDTYTAKGKSASQHTEIDLHGLNQEEARIALEHFLTNCQRRGIRRALIIHGKGSNTQSQGVLRTLVREMLKDLNTVQDFGPAAPKEGGSGATWVSFRYRSR